MFTKRSAVLLCLGVGASVVLALQWDNDYLVRLRARHVKQTIFVSASSRRLAGFFDGLQPDPHWNAAKAAKAAGQVKRCGSAGSDGLVARLLSIFERTVHAQSGCYGTCGGGWAGTLVNNPCFSQYGCTIFTTVSLNGANPCIGTVYSGAQGCTGGSNCAPICNVVSCVIPNCGGGGGCIPDDGSCSQDSDCCSGDCSDNTCTSTEVVVRRGR